jgi:pilus assembly protein CpaD
MNVRKLAASAPRTAGQIAAVVALVSVVVAACSSAPPSVPGLQADTPTQQYPLASVARPERVALAIHPQGLSPNQQVALRDFVQRWYETGGGPIEIGAPGAGADPALAHRTADSVYAFLTKHGAPAAMLKIVDYDPAGSPNAPVYASFSGLQAEVFDCSKTWDNLTSTGDNRPSTHFGCTVTSNMAAQIADPRDLVKPAATESADLARRSVVLAKYRKGEVTSTSKDSQASGEVSQ